MPTFPLDQAKRLVYIICDGEEHHPLVVFDNEAQADEYLAGFLAKPTLKRTLVVLPLLSAPVTFAVTF